MILVRKGSFHRHWMLVILKGGIKLPMLVRKVQFSDHHARVQRGRHRTTKSGSSNSRFTLITVNTSKKKSWVAFSVTPTYPVPNSCQFAYLAADGTITRPIAWVSLRASSRRPGPVLFLYEFQLEMLGGCIK